MIRRLPAPTKGTSLLAQFSLSHQCSRGYLSAVLKIEGATTILHPQRFTKRSQAFPLRQEKRCFWGVDVAFNRVDPERVRLAGSDRAAAEWVLRNGGTIKWMSSTNTLTDYNFLPSTDFESYKLEELDLSSTDVIGIGFEHLKDLHHVRKIKMHNCKTCGDDGLSHFVHVADTLTSVEICSCPMITGQGLQSLTSLKNLKHLVLYNLQDVKNFDSVISSLKEKMPHVDLKTEDPR